MSYSPVQVITAASVDLWAKETDDLELEIGCLMYPPSFQVTAIGQKATAPSFVTVCFSFSEATSDGFYITLPLSYESLSSIKSKYS